MDSESARSRELGCWDGPAACSGLLKIAGDRAPAHDFEPGDDYYDFLMEIGFGKNVDKATRDFWAKTILDNYRGDQGKRRICMAAVALAGRDGLHERLPYVRCPVLWFQVRSRPHSHKGERRLLSRTFKGTNDVVFSVAQAQEDIKRFTNSADAKLVTCQGGVHFLSSTHERQIHQGLLDFIHKWKNWKGGERSVL
jgi:pimeloyl-ACP methyl ester carboxylesterase